MIIFAQIVDLEKGYMDKLEGDTNTTTTTSTMVASNEHDNIEKMAKKIRKKSRDSSPSLDSFNDGRTGKRESKKQQQVLTCVTVFASQIE